MVPLVFLVLLFSSTVYATSVRREPQYSPAISMNHEPTIYASASEMSPYPQHLDLDTLKNMPLVILNPQTPLQVNMIRGENMPDLYKSLTPERIMKLLGAAASNSARQKSFSQQTESPRQAKSLNFDSSQTSSTFSFPLSGHHSFIPQMPSGSISRPFHTHPPSMGWQQRFRNSFSNMFPFTKPLTGMSTANRPIFMPHHQNGFHQPDSFIPFQQHLYHAPTNAWNQFQPAHSLPAEFSTASSFSQPTKLQLGSYFNPFRHRAPQQHFGGDLAMSGSTLMPHRFIPAANHHFAHYVSHVPKHKPLFNNIGGLKGASLEIRNAFADFTDSHEHGPEVGQRFGSVGHVMNKFLDMMGLGPGGGISADEDGSFGGAGNWAAMDSTPISRSLDFYPGYGNQAHLDDIDDFPIFLEDITEKFLTKMNLTHLLAKDSKKNETDEKSPPPADKKKPEEMKMKSTPIDNKMNKTDKSSPSKKDLPGKQGSAIPMSNPQYVPAQPLDMMPKNKEKTSSNCKGCFYRCCSRRQNTSCSDIQKLPCKSNDERAPEPPSYSPAQPLPQHETETNPNKLVDEDILRPWVPVSNGYGYVERRPKSFVDVTQTSELPKGLKIVRQVLSIPQACNINRLQAFDEDF
ncbi:uncharacterized protein TNIN_1661 [Trichonephila inaurata madagascariensis]|uniref:Uncharacterized protein n=1 Tax=Trichonephila inaurata madagascariensis TaxID=2747483 RepID=A0A8X6KCQ5_9ARAC|nr:uncharacterized protein TNIN_1661 [Trichonephila inaurata madagascariensis]